MLLSSHIARTVAIAIAMVTVGLCCISATSDPNPEYVRQQSKAQRYFDEKEWLNASAMYTLILTREPSNTAVYASSIVSHYMSADTIGAVTLMQQAMDNLVPFDSLLTVVQQRAMVAGSGTMYENLLIQARKCYPWLVRSINGHLLDYYNFRNNGPMIVQYAGLMLEGAPDNCAFMRCLARGHLLCGNMDSAAEVWHSILSSDPDHLDTLIDLGTYHYNAGRRQEALSLLSRAYQLAPSPYLAHLISTLN